MKTNNLPFFYNKETLHFINNFEKLKKGVFTKLKSSLDAIDNVELTCNKKEFRVEFDVNRFFRSGKDLEVGQQIKKVKFDYQEKTIVFGSLYIDQFSNQSLKGSINQLYSEGFSKSKKQYFKFVIPYSKSLNSFYQIERIVFLNDSGTTSSLGTKINLIDEEVFILEEKDENKNLYIIIESKKKQTYEEFSNKTFAIRVALGYVTGYFAGNKGYFFSYSTSKMEKFNNFYFSTLRDEIKTLMNPINHMLG
jgi:alpha-glucosidase (family GH31 glycosyl hydrolase)